jgi:anthranilate phosphoribosyltransferase
MRFTSAFNIIGPLTRPCGQTSAIVIGAYSPGVCDQLIAVLKEIGMPAAVAPFGTAAGAPEGQGMDEFSTSGPTRVVELRNGAVETYEVTPSDFGLREVPVAEIASSRTAHENAGRIRAVMEGAYDTPEAEFFCMNAAAALYISGMADSYRRGAEMARQALAEGKALEKMTLLIENQRG